MKHIIKIMDEITNFTFKCVFDNVNDILKKGNFEDEIYVVIHSGGGEVDATFAILDLLESLPNNVFTVNMGIAKSCAGILFIHGKRRYMAKHANFMFHSPATIFKENSHLGTVSLEEQTNNLKFISNQLEYYLKEKTNIPEEIIKSGLSTDSGITYFANDCIKYNIADEIITDISKILY